MFLNERAYAIGTRGETIELVTVFAIVFLTAIAASSLLFGSASWVTRNNQFIVGPLVNCALIIAGINFRGFAKVFGVIFLPSILAIVGGLVFATGSVYMLYMIPVIWVGNAAIVLLFKYLYTHKKMSYIATSLIAVCAKVGLIFAGYNLLTATGIIPSGSAVANTLWTAMGVNQLLTAAIGCVLAWGIIKAFYPKMTA